MPEWGVAFASGASGDNRDDRVDFTKTERQVPAYRPARTARDGIIQLHEAYSVAGLDDRPRSTRRPIFVGRHERRVRARASSAIVCREDLVDLGQEFLVWRSERIGFQEIVQMSP